MFIYGQRTGTLWLRVASDDTIVGRGYSGKKGTSRNNPQHEDKVGEGPIPKGVYRIGPAFKHRRLGPVAMQLHPLGHDARGRTGFYIHGDNREGDASTGCVILPAPVRKQIAAMVELDPDGVTLDVT